VNSLAQDLRFGFLGPYRVAGMGEPWAERMGATHRFLREQGIGAILTLTEDDLYGARHRAAGFRHLHEPVEDTEPPGPEGLRRALAFVDGCLALGTGVAVHCMEGRGRTGTVLCAWVAARESLGPEEAVRRIHGLRPCTVLSPAQRAFLFRVLEDGGR